MIQADSGDSKFLAFLLISVCDIDKLELAVKLEGPVMTHKVHHKQTIKSFKIHGNINKSTCKLPQTAHYEELKYN